MFLLARMLAPVEALKQDIDVLSEQIAELVQCSRGREFSRWPRDPAGAVLASVGQQCCAHHSMVRSATRHGCWAGWRSRRVPPRGHAWFRDGAGAWR